MRDTILYDSALRLFGDHVTPQVPGARPRAGTWPRRCGTRSPRPAISTCSPTGRRRWPRPPRSCAPPAAMRRRSRWPRRCWRAGWRRLRAVDVPAGPLTLAPVEPRRPHPAWSAMTLTGRAGACPGVATPRRSSLLAEGRVDLVPRGAGRPSSMTRTSPASRATSCGSVARRAAAPLPQRLTRTRSMRLGALMRAAQMAGAPEAALALSTRYASDRVQFGRPIGKFQAIQQQLALFAEQVAAATVAVESAAERSRRAALRPDRGAGREDPRRRGRRQGRRHRASGARRHRLHRGAPACIT